MFGIERDSRNAQPRLLVIDDDTLVRTLIRRKLESIGFSCSCVADGNSAIQLLNTQEFDVALCDIRMPGMSGMDVLEHICQHFPGLIVLMITAQKDIDTAVQCMQKGAYDYLVKPIDLTTLEMAIRRALDKRQLVLENLNYHSELEERVEEQTQEIRQAFINSLSSLAYALEAKDIYTSGHSLRVMIIATTIASELGLSEEEIEQIRVASLVHDIGKIGVKESVLNKSGKLTNEEYEHIKTHCEIGERILKPVINDPNILRIVRHHHERYDGKGYPDGLRGNAIPQGARILKIADSFDSRSDEVDDTGLNTGTLIVAVSDAYDAMTSNRPYRKAMDPRIAISEMAKQRGEQFDPAVFDAFLKVLEKNNWFDDSQLYTADQVIQGEKY